MPNILGHEAWADSAADLAAMTGTAMTEHISEEMVKAQTEVLHIGKTANKDFMQFVASMAVPTLKRYDVEDGNTCMKSVDGVLYSADGKSLAAFPAGRRGTFEIPDGVQSVLKDAMRNVQLDGLEVPKSVKTIEKWAFRKSHVKRVKTFNGLGFLGAKIDALEICVGVKSIPAEAFAGCGIVDVALPDGLARIGAKAFKGCHIKRITLPASVQSVGRMAFGCDIEEIVCESEKPIKWLLDAALNPYPRPLGIYNGDDSGYGHPVTFILGGRKIVLPMYIDSSHETVRFREEWDDGKIDSNFLKAAFLHARCKHLRYDTAMEELKIHPDNDAAREHVRRCYMGIAKLRIKQGDTEGLRQLVQEAKLGKPELLKILGLTGDADDSEARAYILAAIEAAGGKPAGLRL